MAGEQNIEYSAKKKKKALTDDIGQNYAIKVFNKGTLKQTPLLIQPTILCFDIL